MTKPITEPITAPSPIDTPTPHTIRTDRPCAKCGFNLFGQPVIREPHYNLTAARCPECGQLAALQEYPALGKWADRWAKLLAALGIIVIFGAIAAQFGPTIGLSISPIDQASRTFAYTIASEYQSHVESQTEGPIQPSQFSANYREPIDREWWNENRATIASLFPRFEGLIRTDAITMWLTLAAITFAFGVFWSTALLGAKRRSAMLVALIAPAVALTMGTLILSSPTYGQALFTAEDAARAHILARLLPITAAIILIPLSLGIFLGRKITRTLVRLALPPRMRSALAILWTRDNLPPPSAKP